MGYLGDYKAEVGIVLGSGFAGFADALYVEEEILFDEIEGVPGSTVKGHGGKFLFAHLGDTPLLVSQGRTHLYEGYSADKVTAGVRFMAECGVKGLVLTNAAGAINPEFSVGGWMLLKDHMNLTGQSPFTGKGAGFPDMTSVYSASWRARFKRAAEAQITNPVYEGVYAGVAGPQYETPAEVSMLRAQGADAVGMSTVLEAMQAHALGVDVVALSLLTNWAAGIGTGALSHEEVLRCGEKAGEEMAVILATALRESAERE